MPHPSHQFVSISVPRYVLDRLNNLRASRGFCREPQYLTLNRVLKAYEDESGREGSNGQGVQGAAADS